MIPKEDFTDVILVIYYAYWFTWGDGGDNGGGYGGGWGPHLPRLPHQTRQPLAMGDRFWLFIQTLNNDKKPPNSIFKSRTK